MCQYGANVDLRIRRMHIMSSLCLNKLYEFHDIGTWGIMVLLLQDYVILSIMAV